ncbi:MAG TPA: BPSS1780 family membrane protein [Janthinobacterium sp.]|nr:BPSS1780 family membrane protein [Janthinobacterium sp.]
MEKLHARTGLLWVKQGFGLFRQQPGGLIILLLAYMFVTHLINIVPWIGPLAEMILMPVFSITFMQAFLHIEEGKRVRPKLLASGFRKPAVFPLMAVGLLYLTALALTLAGASLLDDGLLWKIMTKQIDPHALPADASGGGILLTALVLIPVAMAFVFAAPLIYWKKMSLGKAMFFSFFAVQRALRAFFMFAVAWFTIFVLALQFLMLIFGMNLLALQLLFMTLLIIFQGALYAAYRQIFGSPAEPATLPQAQPPGQL